MSRPSRVRNARHDRFPRVSGDEPVKPVVVTL